MITKLDLQYFEKNDSLKHFLAQSEKILNESFFI